MPSKRVNDMVPKRSIRDISKKDILPPKRVLGKTTKSVTKSSAQEIDTPTAAKRVASSQRIEQKLKKVEDSASIIGGPRLANKVKPYEIETRFENAPDSGSSVLERPMFRKVIYLTLIVLAVVIVGGGLTLTALSRATVNIKPKTVSIPVDMIFTAKKNPTASIEIPYEVIDITQSASTTVDGVEGDFVQTKAKGVVTLYNNQTTPQTLSLNTRIDNTKGLVYRLSRGVTIPAKKTVAGKPVPGSVDVVVVADQPGDVYNSKVMDLSGDFKVIGFKGTPKYSLVFARQKFDITGGYVGREWKISPEIASSTIETLKASVQSMLTTEYAKNVPVDYVAFSGNSAITFSTPEYTNKSNGKVNIKVQGNINGAIISKNSIAGLIMNKQQNKYPLDIFIPENVQDLAYTAITKNFSSKNSQNLIFKLTGNMVLRGNVITDDVRSKLLGKDISESKDIFASYPSIASADVIITPPWMSSLPSKAERLKINIVK